MRLTCPDCPENKSFLVPLWVRATFKVEDNGTVSILHVKPLESLEEKLVEQGKTSLAIVCSECNGDADLSFEDAVTGSRERLEQQALASL